MDVRKVFRNLATGKYMADFDYTRRFAFQAVFYYSPLSYTFCQCSFEHEFLDYIVNNGESNEEVYEKVVQSIIDGYCPHVTKYMPDDWLKLTDVSGLHIAAALGTQGM